MNESLEDVVVGVSVTALVLFVAVNSFYIGQQIRQSYINNIYSDMISIADFHRSYGNGNGVYDHDECQGILSEFELQSTGDCVVPFYIANQYVAKHLPRR